MKTIHIIYLLYSNISGEPAFGRAKSNHFYFQCPDGQANSRNGEVWMALLRGDDLPGLRIQISCSTIRPLGEAERQEVVQAATAWCIRHTSVVKKAAAQNQ